MFEVTFLGTAASRPTAERGVAGLMVFHGTERFLVDCGEGTQRQLARAQIGHRRLNRIFLTHGHLDHILGLAGLVASISEANYESQLTIYGPAEAVRLAKRLLDDIVLPEAGQAAEIAYVVLESGETVVGEAVEVHCIAVPHRDADCLAYCFEEKPRRHFDVAAAERLGVEEGPERQALTRGENVARADGTVIFPDDVLGPPRPAARLAVVGDIGDTSGLVEFTTGVDALIIEATYLSSEVEKARHYGHLTAQDAAEFAGRTGARALYLTHISNRYTGPEILAEARASYPAAVVAEDLLHIEVAHTG